MAYGDHTGPNKQDKGQEGGSCNRGLCQAPGATWYNHGSLAWYCPDCKETLDDAWARRMWKFDFPKANHPQFETREMIDAREKEHCHEK